MLVLNPAGTGAQTNMLPWLSGTFQPMPRRPPHRASRRRWYSPHWLLHAVQRAGQGSNGDLLNGQEHTEINLGAQLFAGGDDIAPPHQKADARARDVEALAQREELHRAFPGARGVEDAAAVGTVKDNIAVGVVMYQQNVVFTAEIDDFGVELRRADAAHGVGGAG